MVRFFAFLFAVILPVAVLASGAPPFDHRAGDHRGRVVFLMPSLPMKATAGDSMVDRYKMRNLIGGCTKTWQSRWAWDYIVRCRADNELVAISKRSPNSSFTSIPKTDQEFERMARPNKILVNVSPWGGRLRDGEPITCYRIMADGIDLAHLPNGAYAVEVCG